MKNFYSLLIVALTGFALSAQSSYDMLPNLDAGYNPGFLNTDPEQPNATGWNSIMASTSTAQWSSSQNIGFPFSFDGSSVSSFVVSNSGVLTFATSPGTAPSSSNQSLPSGILPEKSICVWGLNISGANDKIWSKTFGTTGSRQLWISWSSASHSNMTGASNWTYWSIVLEEGTNRIYIVDQRTYDSNSGNVSITAGIQVNTTNYYEISAALQSRTTATSANGDDPTDNTYYEFKYGKFPAVDFAGLSHDLPGVVKTNSQVVLEGMFRNAGKNAVSNADFNYTINGGSVVTNPLSITFNGGEAKMVQNQTAWNPTADGVYTIEMWLSHPNDSNQANDRITAKVIATSNPPERKPLIEERTGTWCQFCPRGAVAMEYMGMNHAETSVLVAVHNNDPMAVSTYDPNLSGGFPTFTIDRILTEQSIALGTNMESAHDMRREITPIATVDITNVELQGNSVKVDVESEFITDETGADYRYSLIIVEDGVTGTSAGYAQVNAYAGGSTSVIDAKGFDYSQAANPVPASQMVYHHVARAVVPSFSGQSGSVPATITQNQTVTHTFNTTLPSSVINPNHVKVAVVLLDQNNGGEVVNADEKKLTNVVSIKEYEALKVNVYPNPASDFINIELYRNEDLTVNVVNSIGQTVMTESFADTDLAKLNTQNLAEGVYFLNLKAGDETSTIKVVVTK